ALLPGGAVPTPSDRRRGARVSCGGRFCQLRSEPRRRLSSGWRLRGAHSQGRQAGRPARPAAHRVRVRHKPQDGQDARPRSPARCVRPRRRGDRMKRREFITLLGGIAAAWPVAARAQQPGMPVIGFLSSVGRNDRPHLTDAFGRGLSDAGYVEGRNLTIEYRFAANQHDRLPALAAELVGRKVTMILAAGGGNSILAAKAATTTIPIVFTLGGDPVQQGYVASLNRPGGNVTGISWFGALLAAKALGLLHELMPSAAVIALLVNSKLPEAARTLSDAQEAERALGLHLLVLNASTPGEIHAAFACLVERRAGALVVGGDAYLTTRRQQIVSLAAYVAIPAMYPNREFMMEGGLMSYGNDTIEAYRRAELYAARILRGEKPADLPVDQ